LIKAVFLLGKTIICLLAGCVCVLHVSSPPFRKHEFSGRVWVQKWYQITNCCHIMGTCREQACIMTLLLIESKSDNPFEDWCLFKITHEFLLYGEQCATFNKIIHWIQLRESIVVLHENRTKHINRAVWQTAEFVTLQQMVHIVTAWTKSLKLVAEAIFIKCSTVWCDVVRTAKY
jgi:hypothetical protein